MIAAKKHHRECQVWHPIASVTVSSITRRVSWVRGADLRGKKGHAEGEKKENGSEGLNQARENENVRYDG